MHASYLQAQPLAHVWQKIFSASIRVWGNIVIGLECLSRDSGRLGYRDRRDSRTYIDRILSITFQSSSPPSRSANWARRKGSNRARCVGPSSSQSSQLTLYGGRGPLVVPSIGVARVSVVLRCRTVGAIIGTCIVG